MAMAGWRRSGSSPAPCCAAGDSVANGFSPKTIISERKKVVTIASTAVAEGTMSRRGARVAPPNQHTRKEAQPRHAVESAARGGDQLAPARDPAGDRHRGRVRRG